MENQASSIQKNRHLIRALVETAIFAALICVCAPFSIQIGPIPISLATFAIYLCALLLKPGQATLAVAVYVALGAVGVPVFAGFTGGFGKIIGVTGGFIVGYIPCAFLGSLIGSRGSGKLTIPLRIAGLITGTVALYALGSVWYVISTGNTFADTMAVCVIPFLVGDSIKIATSLVLAQLLAIPFRKLHAQEK